MNDIHFFSFLVIIVPSYLLLPQNTSPSNELCACNHLLEHTCKCLNPSSASCKQILHKFRNYNCLKWTQQPHMQYTYKNIRDLDKKYHNSNVEIISEQNKIVWSQETGMLNTAVQLHYSFTLSTKQSTRAESCGRKEWTIKPNSGEMGKQFTPPCHLYSIPWQQKPTV